MNDRSIEIHIPTDSLRVVNVPTPQLLELLDGVFIRQLRNIWGCTGLAEYIPHTMSVRVRISAPELLIYGIERKLEEIACNPADESLYQIDSYPQDHRPRTHATMSTDEAQFTPWFSTGWVIPNADRPLLNTSMPDIDSDGLRLAMTGDALGSLNSDMARVQEAINKKPKPKPKHRNRRITLDVK